MPGHAQPVTVAVRVRGRVVAEDHVMVGQPGRAPRPPAAPRAPRSHSRFRDRRTAAPESKPLDVGERPS
ncbi:hypothetical protein B7767_39555 [Streptomyces sp. 13-12-16]|nr:hypothetical protein B7767_39555 [Streptomyces sp. 13-12-16]